MTIKKKNKNFKCIKHWSDCTSSIWPARGRHCSGNRPPSRSAASTSFSFFFPSRGAQEPLKTSCGHSKTLSSFHACVLITEPQQNCSRRSHLFGRFLGLAVCWSGTTIHPSVRASVHPVIHPSRLYVTLPGRWWMCAWVWEGPTPTAAAPRPSRLIWTAGITSCKQGRRTCVIPSSSSCCYFFLLLRQR